MILSRHWRAINEYHLLFAHRTHRLNATTAYRRTMKRGFFTIMAAQFFSSLADNALFVAAVALLRISHSPEWQQAALVPLFALFYVVLAPFVGAFADSMPKGKVMLLSNFIKVLGCLFMLFGSHPLLAYAIAVSYTHLTLPTNREV